jgi:hypothetical protein
MGRWSMVIAAACVVSLAIAGGGLSAWAADDRTAAPLPKTVSLAHGPIAAFAQDGPYIAWAAADKPPGCVWRVRVRSLSIGRQWRVNRNGGPTCRSGTGFDLSHPTYLALARDRALWTLFDQGNNTYFRLVTGSPRSRETSLEELVFANSSYQEGWHLGGLAGDRATLVYGKVRIGVKGPPDCDINGTCSTVVDGGGVQRIAGGSGVAVPNAPPALAVAASGRRVAFAVGRHGGPPVRPGTPPRVEIRNAITGGLVRSFVAARAPLSVALSSTRVVLLVRTRGARRLLRYSTAGMLVDARSIPSAGSSVSVSGDNVVFAVGRTIKLWDAEGDVAVLANAAAKPIGLSIDGRRVAWAENVTIDGTLRGRVRVIAL